MSITLVMPSYHLNFCRPLLLLPSIFSSTRVFSNELVLCISWPKYWSFSFSISSSNEHSGLISLRMDWLEFLAVQGLSRVFSNTTVQKHQFFGSQLSFSHVTILKFLIIFEQGSCSTLYWSPQKYVANPRKISGLIFSNSQSINFSLKFSHLWAIKFLY